MAVFVHIYDSDVDLGGLNPAMANLDKGDLDQHNDVGCCDRYSLWVFTA